MRRKGREMTDRSNDSIVRLPEVRRRTGLSRPTIYRKMASGAFPPRIVLSSSMVGWYESDINRWVADPVGWSAEA